MNYQDRIEKFQNILGSAADLAFFPISADLEYLTGVPRDIPNFGATLHPGGWLEGAWFSPKYAPILTLSRMGVEFGGHSDLKSVELRMLGEFADPAELVKDILKSWNIPSKPRIAIGDPTRGETASELHKILPEATFLSGTALLNPLRRVKSAEEIAVMRKAGEITEAAFQAVLGKLKIGMTELDLISEVDYQLRRQGSLGPSFTTSLYNSGPHHPLMFGKRLETWPRVLTPPVSILFDFGAAYDGFCYDYGRTAFFGEPDAEMQRVYQLVMESQRVGIAAMKAGQVTCAEVDAAARKVIEDAGYGKEFRHRLGHGIGMDVHEAPFLTASDHTPIVEGMMFTVEPSITQTAKFSARVEDVVVARPDGGEKLTNGYQSLIVVE